MTSFSELGLPSAIAEAIVEKKFEKATRVQAAVMNPELRGRDLLVSAETGSGKTLAFGSVLARELLAEDGTAEKPRGVRQPRALVIAPTRELATQVRGELAWLFAKTGWRLGAFTGGTDVWGDLRTLKTGVDVVVGTPGRLVDLVTRGSLPLATIEAVVLDEADEMLDMGFREDLEKLLSAASARRLTLLFSATLPADILGLARRYQKDAVRIDTRQGGSVPHADIHYVAYLTAVGEKFAAVMNILRVHDAKRSIVFGQTRDGVATLHEALVQRGVKAVVLSGERSQAERTRALAVLKRGEASVLVATNVAARGLDLPEVDLVIHADLPSNVEALTHRSGRTGRAGRKGTSVIVAQLTERRKAERLMSMARLQTSWQAPPDAAAVAAHAEQRLVASLSQELGLANPLAGDADADELGQDDDRELASAGDTDADADDVQGDDSAGVSAAPSPARAAKPRSAADQALDARVGAFLAAFGEVDQQALLRGLLRRELARLPAGDRLSRSTVPQPGAPRDQTGSQSPAERRARFAGGAVVFRVNIGVRQNAEAGWLLPLICRRGGVTRKEVGAIRIGPHASEFEIARDAADDYALAAAQPDPRAPQVEIVRADGGAPSRAHAGAGASTRVEGGASAVARPPRKAPAASSGEHAAAKRPRTAAAAASRPAEPDTRHAVETEGRAPAQADESSEASSSSPREASSSPREASSSPREASAVHESEALPQAAAPAESAAPAAKLAPELAEASASLGDADASAPAAPAPKAAPHKPRAAKSPAVSARSSERAPSPAPRPPRANGLGSPARKGPATGPRSDGPSYEERKPRYASSREPWQARTSAERPAILPGTEPSGARRGPTEPFGAKPGGAKPYGAKPYGAKPYGAKPFGEKPYAAKPFGAKPFGAKPYGAKSFDAKPYGAKPFGTKTEGRFEGPKSTASGFEGSRPAFVKGGDGPLPRRPGTASKPSRPPSRKVER